MAMTGQELASLAMRHFSYEKPSELAARLSLKAYSSPRRVKRWLDGEVEPDYEQTMALLELLNMLKASPEAKAAGEESTPDLPQSFEDQVEMLSQLMRETIQALRESRPAAPATGRSQKPKTGTDG